MIRLALLMLALLSDSSYAQMSSERLLSGTTLGLPWGIYAGSAASLQTDSTRLRISAPSGARILGTRYDPGSRSALVSYRHGQNARSALEFAVEQLQRQGFELTFRSWPGEGRAQALLRRNESLVEIRITRGAEHVTQALYRFKNGRLPERLMVGELPSFIEAYAGPVDLKTVQTERGRVVISPPSDVLLDLVSYRNGVVSLQFYSNYTLAQLRDFYLPFFIAQGFIEVADAQKGASQTTYRFARGDERLTVELQSSTASRARVEFRYQR